jgi:hypothetical protein
MSCFMFFGAAIAALDATTKAIAAAIMQSSLITAPRGAILVEFVRLSSLKAPSANPGTALPTGHSKILTSFFGQSATVTRAEGGNREQH